MEEVITISQRQSYLHLSASSLRKSAPEVPPFVGVIIAQVSTANAIGSLFLGLRWMSWWRRTEVATNGDQYHIPGHHGGSLPPLERHLVQRSTLQQEDRYRKAWAYICHGWCIHFVACDGGGRPCFASQV